MPNFLADSWQAKMPYGSRAKSVWESVPLE